MARHVRPEPLLTRAHITATIAGLIALLVTVGIIPQVEGDSITNAANVVMASVSTIFATVVPYIHALTSRSAVTPVADPRDNHGNKLVAVGSAGHTVDAALTLAQMDKVHPGS